MAAKKTKTAKRRTTTKELPKSKTNVKTETRKKVKGGTVALELKGWDQKDKTLSRERPNVLTLTSYGFSNESRSVAPTFDRLAGHGLYLPV